MACTACPAGQRRTLSCDWAINPSCLPCSQGTYSDIPNIYTDCLPCGKRCNIKHQVVVGKCSSRRNIVCQCKSGFFLRNNMEMSCEKHTLCPPGSGVFTPGTPITDNVCKPCPPGTYSDLVSSARCLPHTSCGKLGVRYAGSNLTDNVCNSTPSTDGTMSTTSIALISSFGAVLIVLLVVILLVWAWRRRAKCKRNIPATNRRTTEGNDLNTNLEHSPGAELLIGANIKGSTKTLNTYPSVSDDGDIISQDMDIPPSFQEGVVMEEIEDLDSFMRSISLVVPPSHPLLINLPGDIRMPASLSGEGPHGCTFQRLKWWREDNPREDHVGVLQRAMCYYQIQLPTSQ